MPSSQFTPSEASAAAVVCERAVRAEPTARTHFLLCRSNYYAGRYDQSFEHCTKALSLEQGATTNLVLARSIQAMHFRYGHGTQRNDQVAFREFMSSESVPESALELGMMHYFGIGTSRDYQKAAAYLERADRAGLVHGAFLLAYLHRDGAGVPRNPRMAEQLWRRAAEAGHQDAQLEYGLLAYHRQNIGDARDMFLRAAAQGNAVAKRNLAILIMEGPRQNRNEAEAFRLFLEAAEGGDRPSMKQVAICYGAGMLVDRNLVESERWVQRLSATNDPAYDAWARQYLSDLRGLMLIGFLLPRRTPWDQADRDLQDARGEANRARSEAQQEIWRERMMNWR